MRAALLGLFLAGCGGAYAASASVADLGTDDAAWFIAPDTLWSQAQLPSVKCKRGHITKGMIFASYWVDADGHGHRDEIRICPICFMRQLREIEAK